MTEHKFTDDEIIRALECCSRNVPLLNSCEGCPFDGKRCAAFLPQVAFDLIKRYKAENEDLEIKNEHLVCFLAEARKDAIKEFAERLKKVNLYEFIEEYFENAELRYEVRRDWFDEYIDNLVKEMTEGER